MRRLAFRSILFLACAVAAWIFLFHSTSSSQINSRRKSSRLQAQPRPSGPIGSEVERNDTRVYDFIIVGGGQSGLVVANRLSETGHTVLVIEYGEVVRDDPLISRPWQPFNSSAGEMYDPKLMYNYTSVPQNVLNNRRTNVYAAATAGGGSTVNSMMLSRGSRADYDAWEALGNPGWGWDVLLPYFRRSVTFTPPGERLQEQHDVTFDEAAAYGGSGPIHVSFPGWVWPGLMPQMQGWHEMGIKKSKEGAGGDAHGMISVPRAQDSRTQTRSYSVTGHLDAAMSRPNFEMLAGHRVRSVLLDESNKAYGVVVKRRNVTESRTITARKEVILAAGLHSSLILQRSGIGRTETLLRADVKPRIDLPGVGMNLQDHPAAGIAFDFQSDLAYTPTNLTTNATFAAEMQALFDRTRAGPYAGAHTVASMFTAADIAPPSFFTDQLQWQSAHLEATLAFLPREYSLSPELLTGFFKQRELLLKALLSDRSTQLELPLTGDSYALHILQKPLSRGSVSIDPWDPLDGPPLVDFQTLANPIDLEMMMLALKRTRVWAGTSAMSVLTPVERWPMTATQAALEENERESAALGFRRPFTPPSEGVEDERLRIHIRSNAESSTGHVSGTCAMMPQELGGVVDNELRVYGTTGLSVVDASIIPLIPSAGLGATVYAVAEKVSCNETHVMRRWT